MKTLPIAKLKQKTEDLFKAPFFTNPKTILFLWIGISIFLGISKTLTGRLHNNYQIYKYVFFNILDQFSLFTFQPSLYDDLNHYGPIFGFIIAPFAILPDIVGGTLWLVALALVLYYSVNDLQLKQWQKVAIFWISTNSLIIAHTNVQFNTATAALIILSFTLIRKEKNIWAAFVIMLGTFVKLYGIVGFAFFFFSKNKTKLLIWSLIWSIVFFVLPMLISSPDYIIHQYKEWFVELVNKSTSNDLSFQQNISFLGMVRKSIGNAEMSNGPMLLGAIILMAIPFLQVKKFNTDYFQLLTLASVLIFTVLFSTGSEPNTYIIAIIGVAIWFVIQPRPLSKLNIFLLIFAIAISSFSPSDLFPRSIYKQFIQPYALQALPCTLIWLKIVYEMTFLKSNEYLHSPHNS
ncbi:MAG: glycosyltransferase family 87 protein [Bacteroidales bacterium]